LIKDNNYCINNTVTKQACTKESTEPMSQSFTKVQLSVAQFHKIVSDPEHEARCF